MCDFLTLLRAVQASPWAREFMTEQEQTRFFILELGVGEDEAEAVLEAVKQDAIKRSVSGPRPFLELYREGTAAMRGLLEKGVPVRYILNNVQKIRR